MNDRQIKTAIGGMLHDIGKFLYRDADGRSHSIRGEEFLRECGVTDPDILEQVRFHHSSQLLEAAVPEDSLAYITWWADNVAAGADGRKADDGSGEDDSGLAPLESVFNILNGNRQEYTYDLAYVADNGVVEYPKETAGQDPELVYDRISANIRTGISGMAWTREYAHALLSLLEANLSFLSSSADISLYDHMKTTAAVGSCILEYLEAQGIRNYRETLYENAERYYGEKTFLLYSMDISGIQEFIFAVDNKGALRSLRAKSFYLEIMLEHIIDELLERLDLTRANLIYSGGGHAYLLLPRTVKVEEQIAELNRELRRWYIDHFGIELYVAAGYAACSAYDLQNKPEGSYSDLFRTVSRRISDSKASRYTAEEIEYLNSREQLAGSRECRVCRRTDHLTEEDLCEFCSGFREISGSILRENFISILTEPDPAKPGLRLPLDRFMVMESETELKARMQAGKNYLRSYSKNRLAAGFQVSTKLWVGDYATGGSFWDLANSATGIKRIGVLRADVDNLGEAFVRGFDAKHTSLSRTATFSRKLSMFFKLHINYLLAHGQYSLSGEPAARRKAVIVYSGGDDLFLVGAWDDVIGSAVDLSRALEKYSQGTLSISAGIGMYPGKYPVKAFARQTGELEETSKDFPGKNALTLFEPSGGNTYHWKTFTDSVVGEKYALIEEYFSQMPGRGTSMLNKLRAYISGLDDTINLARLAYMLGRMEPGRNDPEELWELHRKFSKTLYGWISGKDSRKDRRELLTAISLYQYLHRESKEGRHGESD